MATLTQGSLLYVIVTAIWDFLMFVIFLLGCFISILYLLAWSSMGIYYKLMNVIGINNESLSRNPTQLNYQCSESASKCKRYRWYINDGRSPLLCLPSNMISLSLHRAKFVQVPSSPLPGVVPQLSTNQSWADLWFGKTHFNREEGALVQSAQKSANMCEYIFFLISIWQYICYDWALAMGTVCSVQKST